MKIVLKFRNIWKIILHLWKHPNIMGKIDAKKDGTGNIIMPEESFKTMLNCFDKQVFHYEINNCMDILNQKYIFEATNEEYWLTKKYEIQDEVIPWSSDDIAIVHELFKDTIIEYKEPKNLKPITDDTPLIKDGPEPLGIDEDGWVVCRRDPTPWLIERPMRHDYMYLTISENGESNRPWKKEEVERIVNAFK